MQAGWVVPECLNLAVRPADLLEACRRVAGITGEKHAVRDRRPDLPAQKRGNVDFLSKPPEDVLFHVLGSFGGNEVRNTSHFGLLEQSAEHIAAMVGGKHVDSVGPGLEQRKSLIDRRCHRDEFGIGELRRLKTGFRSQLRVGLSAHDDLDFGWIQRSQ